MGDWCSYQLSLEEAIIEVKTEKMNTQRGVNSLRTELEKTRLKISNIEDGLKRTNMILHNFDPSRQAQILLEDVVTTFNQFIPNASIRLNDIKEVFRITCNQNPAPFWLNSRALFAGNLF